MNLKINTRTQHYRPMLISIWGKHPDLYYETAVKWYIKHVHTPTAIALFAGEGLHDVFNESIQYCMDHQIKFMILVNQTIAPRADWSEIFRGMDMKTKAFIYKNDKASFIVINVKKVRKYEYFRVIGSPKELHKWLVAKAKSEGNNFRPLNEIELTYIGASNEESESESSRQGGREKLPGKTKSKKQRSSHRNRKGTATGK